MVSKNVPIQLPKYPSPWTWSLTNEPIRSTWNTRLKLNTYCIISQVLLIGILWYAASQDVSSCFCLNFIFIQRSLFANYYLRVLCRFESSKGMREKGPHCGPCCLLHLTAENHSIGFGQNSIQSNERRMALQPCETKCLNVSLIKWLLGHVW